ncbi:hypothetical protein H0N95_01515 [Candidatus Micrarchaeota archaeon]|nr:hypothetical protein [Candidatus Micrarchaeota archaeon]
MIQALFAQFAAVIILGTAVYSYFYDKKAMPTLFAALIFSLVCVEYWFIAPLILVFAIWSERMTYGTFAAMNLLSAVFMSYFMIWLYPNVGTISVLPFALAFIVCSIAIFGIFENHLRRYLMISSASQIAIIALHLSITGSYVWATMQVFNYAIAGLCLFLTIGVFARNKTFIYELEGSVNTDRLNDAFATIACLSLAGLPLFNMFVSEWHALTVAFASSPATSVLMILSSVLLFIMYYKITYVLLVGEGKRHEAPKLVTIINGFLALMIIALGLTPAIAFIEGIL